MPKLLKEGILVDDEWSLQETAVNPEQLPTGKYIVPLSFWLDHREQLLARGDIGVWLDSDESPSQLAPDLAEIPLVAINFPVFADGRGYSYARLIRERYHFDGELRAIGDVLVDQLYFMKRCGFDTYALRDDQDIETGLAGLETFSESYQTGTDQPIPLFRRR